jgi:transcriptional regulator NrdR family protein
MPEHHEHISRIQEKLQQLVRQHQLLAKENEKLQKELDLSLQKEKIKQEQVDQLVQQVAILKAAKTTLNDEDKKDFEKRINQYLRDIDKCITLLSE